MMKFLLLTSNSSLRQGSGWQAILHFSILQIWAYFSLLPLSSGGIPVPPFHRIQKGRVLMGRILTILLSTPYGR
ncbi:hypothetical protein KBD81_05835 [Candidatus Woesebacteria bacterium]|nr:hypothetical protein [Candidatus Woesebacteria bacterium]